MMSRFLNCWPPERPAFHPLHPAFARFRTFPHVSLSADFIRNYRGTNHLNQCTLNQQFFPRTFLSKQKLGLPAPLEIQ
jgi:hypothetical protein